MSLKDSPASSNATSSNPSSAGTSLPSLNEVGRGLESVLPKPLSQIPGTLKKLFPNFDHRKYAVTRVRQLIELLQRRGANLHLERQGAQDVVVAGPAPAAPAVAHQDQKAPISNSVSSASLVQTKPSKASDTPSVPLQSLIPVELQRDVYRVVYANPGAKFCSLTSQPAMKELVALAKLRNIRAPFLLLSIPDIRVRIERCGDDHSPVFFVVNSGPPPQWFLEELRRKEASNPAVNDAILSSLAQPAPDPSDARAKAEPVVTKIKREADSHGEPSQLKRVRIFSQSDELRPSESSEPLADRDSELSAEELDLLAAAHNYLRRVGCSRAADEILQEAPSVASLLTSSQSAVPDLLECYRFFWGRQNTDHNEPLQPSGASAGPFPTGSLNSLTPLWSNPFGLQIGAPLLPPQPPQPLSVTPQDLSSWILIEQQRQVFLLQQQLLQQQELIQKHLRSQQLQPNTDSNPHPTQ